MVTAPITYNVTINFALIVGVTASLIGLAATIPQVVRARRTSVEGLSWGSQLLTLATCTTTIAASLAAWLISPLTVGMIGSVIGSVRLVPQLRLALSGQPLWGLDPWAVQLALGSSGIWLAYGLAATDIAVISSAGLAAIMNTAICARRLPPRRTLRSIADGRIGPHAARYATPVATLVRAPINAPLSSPVWETAA